MAGKVNPAALIGDIRLQAAGLAEPETVKERGPTKEVYSLTGAGRAALRAWLADSTLELATPRDPFLLKLFFARRAAPATARALVTAYREHVARLLEEWEQQERNEPEATPIDVIALRFAILRSVHHTDPQHNNAGYRIVS